MTNQSSNITIEDMATFCKRRGFIYPSGDIYGGLAGFFDYGPLGAELKNNLKNDWWKTFVHGRADVVGIDGSIITNPTVWKASGHADCFEDVMLECKNCKARMRGDHLIEDALKIQADGLSKEDITKLVQENNIKCSKCGKEDLGEGKQFNLMLTTNVGPVESDSSKSYLRPETAQLIFTNFKLVQENSRLKLPFGIAQMGKAFRNEISPRDFLFRCREFEQMEIEYFIHPDKGNDCPYIDEVMDHELLVASSEMQEKKESEKKMKISDALKANFIKTQWHGYWLAEMHKWFISLGATPDNFRIRQHLTTEKSHYALDTWDLEYKFPFGWKELQGMANRTDFDLQQHIKHSKKDLSIHDEETKQKIVPHVVAEPSQGVDRAFLVFMFDAYTYDKERDNIVLKLHPKLSPIKAGIFPLVNKEGLPDKAKEIFNKLKKDIHCAYDQSGSIGRRYARNDEIGTPYGITVDFDSLKNGDVTLRDRDTTKQKRIKISDIKDIIRRLIDKEINFEDL
ncbi:glycine--tRNA ligase [Nanoarchaeota archaeon]